MYIAISKDTKKQQQHQKNNKNRKTKQFLRNRNDSMSEA
jgi:hypothetical protein